MQNAIWNRERNMQDAVALLNYLKRIVPKQLMLRTQVGFLTKRFNAVSRNSETSETSGYFAKFFASFASVSRNISRNSEKLKILRNNRKIGKLWLTSHLFLFSFSRNKITVSVFRETRFAETACFAKQQNRRNDPFCFAKQRNAFRETVKNWKFREIIAK